ncbi:MAG: hypothetical protein EOQ50_31780 [Mesorhizobium sp.]|uniref:hypothetical protein n=1 Tax=Mesorhizobium sp. TaxID=1871066 RepID=UPI000FE46108|nr:hypothetical protein [Mesorhizobium sp.]RWB66891.1 MAG: hypothetical protein EOQ50_31780 [Mesorhizobium sp.]RWL80304.1 MAG: hypothetical protein EOR69_22690 [Mesorhizobium sp.]RWL85927.1 MAG: hypothetical protein EOR67_21090 [Mesorhizobium sp.]RWL93121.1 MAG: hypothetical protein EOR70_29350 [Mesorhizobium sp.]TIP03303.1 MAG: hypothetical protein E5X72_16710 [Mesorhizobium sp.]
MRFAAMQNPCDDWHVYDLALDPPPEMDGRVLIGLTRGEAEQLEQANAEFLRRPPVPLAIVA